MLRMCGHICSRCCVGLLIYIVVCDPVAVVARKPNPWNEFQKAVATGSSTVFQRSNGYKFYKGFKRLGQVYSGYKWANDWKNDLIDPARSAYGTLKYWRDAYRRTATLGNFTAKTKAWYDGILNANRTMNFFFQHRVSFQHRIRRAESITPCEIGQMVGRVLMHDIRIFLCDVALPWFQKQVVNMLATIGSKVIAKLAQSGIYQLTLHWLKGFVEWVIEKNPIYNFPDLVRTALRTVISDLSKVNPVAAVSWKVLEFAVPDFVSSALDFVVDPIVGISLPRIVFYAMPAAEYLWRPIFLWSYDGYVDPVVESVIYTPLSFMLDYAVERWSCGRSAGTWCKVAEQLAMDMEVTMNTHVDSIACDLSERFCRLGICPNVSAKPRRVTFVTGLSEQKKRVGIKKLKLSINRNQAASRRRVVTSASTATTCADADVCKLPTATTTAPSNTFVFLDASPSMRFGLFWSWQDIGEQVLHALWPELQWGVDFIEVFGGKFAPSTVLKSRSTYRVGGTEISLPISTVQCGQSSELDLGSSLDAVLQAWRNCWQLGTLMWQRIHNRLLNLSGAPAKVIVITDGEDNHGEGEFYGIDGMDALMRYAGERGQHVEWNIIVLDQDMKEHVARRYQDLSQLSGGTFSMIETKRDGTILSPLPLLGR